MNTNTPPPEFHVTDTKQWASQLHGHGRPLLAHLNADTTWIIQLPYPPSAPRPRGRTHYNILLDPWLQGPQSDVASFFSTQWHVVAASIPTLADLNNTLKELESLGTHEEPETDFFIDVVAISHEFTDHCHRATLEELPKNTPVFATDVAADLIRSWGYFDKVFTAPGLSEGVPWTKLIVGPLPRWLSIGRVITPGNALYYHSAVLIAFNLSYDPDAPRDTIPTAEAVIYSPHGIQSSDLASLKASGIQSLALMHGMHDVRIWMTKQLNLGALNGIKAVGVSGSKYWVATHDEIKTGWGLIAPFLLRTQYSLKEAVEDEQIKLEKEGKAPEYNFSELGSGNGIVLV